MLDSQLAARIARVFRTTLAIMDVSQLGKVTMIGPAIDDAEILKLVPEELSVLLHQANGFILFDGALHVRGAVKSPPWHSLRHAMEGEDAFSTLYASVDESDIPFAQDCMGDQFLLRNGRVFLLRAETGDIEEHSADLDEFWNAVRTDAIGFLSFDPNTTLEPGQLLHAYPPFCTKESSNGCSIKPASAIELIRYHAEFAKFIRGVPDGAPFEVKIGKQ